MINGFLQNLKIRNKLVIIFFCITVIPSFLLFALFYSNMKKEISAKIEQSYQFAVFSTSKLIDNYLKDFNVRLSFVQEIERSPSMSWDRAYALLLQAQNSNRDFTGLFLLSEKGKTIVQVLDSGLQNKISFLENS